MQGPSTGKLNKAVRRKPAECTHDVFARVVPPDEIADICRQLGYAYRKRLFTPVVTMAAMLLQALSKDKSQKNAVVQTMTQRLACGLPAGSHDPSSLCAARQRLPLELLKRVTRLAANRQRQQAGGDAAWWGRRVVLADGSSCSMLDTPENQAFFGQPSGQKPGCGFPVASLCAMFNLTTGVVFDLAVGPYVASEHDLWHQLWPSLRDGDLAVADRLYGTYAEILLLRQRGVDCAFRVQQTRKLPPGGWTDRVVTWQKGPRPKWMSPEQYAALPDTQQVRLVRFRIKEPGVRTCCVTLVSTLLNRKRYPRKKLAALYGRRWNVETNLNHLKTSLGMNVLACESAARREARNGDQGNLGARLGLQPRPHRHVGGRQTPRRRSAAPEPVGRRQGDPQPSVLRSAGFSTPMDRAPASESRVTQDSSPPRTPRAPRSKTPPERVPPDDAAPPRVEEANHASVLTSSHSGLSWISRESGAKCPHIRGRLIRHSNPCLGC